MKKSECRTCVHPRERMQALVAVVKEYRARRAAGDPAELEVRVGQASNQGSFRAGISRHVFEQLHDDLQDAPSLAPEKDWVEFVDYFYYNNGKKQIRTRVEFNADNMEVSKTHITKQVQRRAVAHRAEDGDACRITCSTETPVTDLPNVCIPVHVRVQQRKRFHDVREGNLVWVYEVSKVWSGPNRKLVERKQHEEEPAYEVECELADVTGDYMACHTDEEIACSLELKSRLLVGDDTVQLSIIDDSPAHHQCARATGKA